MYSQLSGTGKMCQSYKDVRLKAGFHERRSRSQSCNQKARSLWSGENSVLTPLTLCLLRSAYDLVKTRLLESEAEAEELNQSQRVGMCIVIGLSFHSCFWQSGFH